MLGLCDPDSLPVLAFVREEACREVASALRGRLIAYR